MLKTAKNLRKLYNAKLLFVSSDVNVKQVLGEKFDQYFKEVEFVDNAKQAIILASYSKYDLVVIDTNIDGLPFSELCSKLTSLVPNLPKIIISNENNDNDIISAISSNSYTFIPKPITSLSIRLSLVMCLNQTKRGDKVEFKNGIYFDEYRDQFFKNDGVLIEFTKLEKGFLKLLISKKDELVEYDLIRDVVWKGKSMSIYTMRNIVNKIRQKSYYEIVHNYSNKGYILGNTKIQ